MYKNISIIIPSYNSAKTIGITLSSILKQQHYNFLKEIIIVDSSDDKETKKIIETFRSDKIIKLHPGTKIMPAIGRNIGASHASGDILVFFDSDVIPCKNHLQIILNEVNKGHLAGVGSIELPNFQKRNLIALTQYYLQVSEYFPTGRTRKQNVPAGCNMFCVKEIFDTVGGYPEIRASEDVLIGKKISAIQDMWFVPDAEVAHIFREDWRGFLKNQELLGKYVAIYRKMNYSSRLFNPHFSVFLCPVFFSYKCFRIIARVFSSNFKNVFMFTGILPFFLIGVFFWTRGFLKGCNTK